MKRFLAISLTALLALLLGMAAVFTWLLNDEAWLAKRFESAAGEFAGRPLRVKEPLDIDFGSVTVIEARVLTLDDAQWSKEEHMAKVERLRVTLDWPGLFSSAPLVRHVLIEGVSLVLRESEQGESNWDGLFARPAGRAELPGEPSNGDPGSLLGKVEVRRLDVIRAGQGGARELVLAVETLDAEVLADGHLQTQARGDLDGQALALHGRFGPISHLAGGGRVSAQLEASAGEVNLHFKGDVADAGKLVDLDLTVEFSGPEFEWITRQFAVPEFSSGPFNFDLRIETGNGQAAIGLNGDLGSLDIDASGTLDDLLSPSSGDMSFDVSGPDLAALSAALGREIPLGVAYSLQGAVSIRERIAQIRNVRISAGENRAVVSGAIGLGSRRTATDMDLRLAGPDFREVAAALGVPRLPAGAFRVSARVAESDAGMQIENLALEIGAHDVALSGLIGREPEWALSRFDIEASGPDFSVWQDALRMEGVPQQAYELDLRLERAPGAWLSLDGRLEAGGNSLRIGGSLEALPSLVGSSLWLEATIAEPETVPALPDGFRWPDASLLLRGRLDLAADAWLLEDVSASLSGHELLLGGRIARGKDRSGSRLDGRLESPSLAASGAWFGAVGLPDAPVRAGFDAEWLESGLRLNIESGRLGEMDLELEAKWPAPSVPESLALDFKVSADQLADLPLTMPDGLSALAGRFEASGRIDLGPDRDRLSGIELRVGQLEAQVDGQLRSLGELADGRFSIDIQSPGLPLLGEVLDRSIPEWPFEAGLEITTGKDRFQVELKRAEWGTSELFGHIELRIAETLSVSGKLQAAQLDLAWLDESSGQPDSPAGGRVFIDEPLPPVDAGRWALDLELDIARLVLPLTELRDLYAGVQFRERLLQLQPLGLQGMHGGELRAEMSIEGGAETSVALAATARQLRLGLVSGDTQQPGTYPPTDFDAELKASGTTMHELAAALDGRLVVSQGQGSIANRGLDTFFSDALSELFRTINPFAEQSAYTQMECAVLGARAEDGHVIIDTLIFQTARLVILSGGTVDLNTEKLSMDFRSQARQGAGISAGMIINPFIRLAGTLASPALVFDPVGSALSGTAAVATAGLSLLGKSLYDRFLSSRDPCGDALAELPEFDAVKP